MTITGRIFLPMKISLDFKADLELNDIQVDNFSEWEVHSSAVALTESAASRGAKKKKEEKFTIHKFFEGVE